MAKDDDDDDSNNTVHEKIKFTSTREIDRAFPVLLADTGKMSLLTWNSFCDKVDDAAEPLQKCSVARSALGIGAAICLLLLCTGWMFSAGNYPAFYPGVGTALVVLVIFSHHVGASTHKKVASKISQLCASACNHDRDLTMTLQNVDHDDSDEADEWYIEVTVRNITDAENQYATATATATAVPVGGAAASSEAPKKYVPDAKGKLRLNPEYKAWKAANP